MKSVVQWSAFGLYLLVPGVTGWLSYENIECTYCLGPATRHALATFGYFLLGGFALSYTQPHRPGPSSPDRVSNRPSINYREDVQEMSFWGSLLFAGTHFATYFNWELYFM